MTKAMTKSMTRLERIARDLAAVLSPQGEADWRRYVPMAKDVGTRLCRQFDDIMRRPDSRHGGRRAA
jgi:hypothetical protein